VFLKWNEGHCKNGEEASFENVLNKREFKWDTLYIRSSESFVVINSPTETVTHVATASE